MNLSVVYQQQIWTLCPPNPFNNPMNPFSNPVNKLACLSIPCGTFPASSIQYDHLKDTDACPFVGTFNSLHNLKSNNLGTVPAPSYLHPHPNKIPSYSFSDLSLKAKEQKLPIIAARDFHRISNVKSLDRVKHRRRKSPFCQFCGIMQKIENHHWHLQL